MYFETILIVFEFVF